MEKEARIARDETTRMRADFETRLKETYAEIPRILEVGRREAEADRDRIKGEALEAINLLAPKLVVPMHYGDIVGTLADAERLRSLSSVPVVILEAER